MCFVILLSRSEDSLLNTAVVSLGEMLNTAVVSLGEMLNTAVVSLGEMLNTAVVSRGEKSAEQGSCQSSCDQHNDLKLWDVQTK